MCDMNHVIRTTWAHPSIHMNDVSRPFGSITRSFTICWYILLMDSLERMIWAGSKIWQDLESHYSVLPGFKRDKYCSTTVVVFVGLHVSLKSSCRTTVRLPHMEYRIFQYEIFWNNTSPIALWHHDFILLKAVTFYTFFSCILPNLKKLKGTMNVPRFDGNKIMAPSCQSRLLNFIFTGGARTLKDRNIC